MKIKSLKEAQWEKLIYVGFLSASSITFSYMVGIELGIQGPAVFLFPILLTILISLSYPSDEPNKQRLKKEKKHTKKGRAIDRKEIVMRMRKNQTKTESLQRISSKSAQAKNLLILITLLLITPFTLAEKNSVTATSHIESLTDGKIDIESPSPPEEKDNAPISSLSKANSSRSVGLSSLGLWISVNARGRYDPVNKTWDRDWTFTPLQIENMKVSWVKKRDLVGGSIPSWVLVTPDPNNFVTPNLG